MAEHSTQDPQAQYLQATAWTKSGIDGMQVPRRENLTNGNKSELPVPMKK